MSAYEAMKMLIEQANRKLNDGKMAREEYELFKARSIEKLDCFLTCDSITTGNYSELKALLEIYSTATE